MTALDTTVLKLLGKIVKFSYQDSTSIFPLAGVVTDIVFNIDGEHSISVDSGEIYLLSELLEFDVLDVSN